MRELFYYKMRQKFITKCARFFISKCDSFITKCDSYYKLRRFYYKMRQLLQNATFITNCDSALWYISQIYTIPKYIKKEIERTYDFLWNGKIYDLPVT